MKSIKFYLVVAIVSVMTLTLFLAALRGYQASIVNMESLFDAQLQDMANVILNARSVETTAASKNTLAIDRQSAHGILFQVWSDNGNLLAANTEMIEPLTDKVPGFSERNVEGYRWRILTQPSSGEKIWVMVAERSDLRFQMADLLVAESILPVVINVPIAALMIWWFIGRGMSLLKRLANDLSSKRAEDLSPLIYEQTPKELTIVVESINKLFNRLQNAFDRERHFASDAAHELRTPISALKVHIHNLKATFPDQYRELSLLEGDVNRLSHVIEQILLLYRTSSDNAHFQPVSVNLTELAQEVVSEIYPLFEEAQQEVSLLVEDEISVTGDRRFLTILLRNLMSNANKYAPNCGSIEIDIQRDQDTVTLIVADSGNGIPEQERSRVFDRFYRVGGDRHASGKSGCGLGLAIVKHIADLHQADIHFATIDRNQGDSMFAVIVKFYKQLDEKVSKC